MAFVAQDAVDAALEYLADNGEELVLLSGEPSGHADALSKELADAALTVGAGAGDWTVQAGDAGGTSRKATLAAQTCSGSADGTATHYAILDNTNSVLLYWNTMTNVAISNGVDQDVQEVDVLEIGSIA